LDQPVGQRRLAMVDMGDNREIADVCEVGHLGATYKRRRTLSRPTEKG